MKVASARDRYTEEERAVSGPTRRQIKHGPLLLLEVKYPARLHRQAILANVVNHGVLTLPYTRREGGYLVCWLVHGGYASSWFKGPPGRRRLRRAWRVAAGSVRRWCL